MAGIPKKYKKQIKHDIRNAKSLGKVSSVKRTWSFKKGDLVKWGDVMGVIAEERTGGYYLIISPNGNQSVHAKNLERVQRISAD